MSFLGLYRDPVVATVTGRCDWRIADLVDRPNPVPLYLVVPPSDIARTKPLMRLVLNQIGRRLTESLNTSRNRQQLLLMLDEFAALGRLDFFESQLAFMAGYGIRSFLITQSLNQLERAYGPNHAILDNCHGVLLVQPRNWAMDVARIDLSLARGEGGAWRLSGVSSPLLPVEPDTPADPEILELARPYHEAAERYLDQPVAESGAELSGARGRFEDSALVDAIHEVQMHCARADVSFSSLFNPRVRVPRGKVTARELAALYHYDNELYAVEGDGRMVREALENAARYFRTCPEPSCDRGPLVDRAVAGYNYDMAQGVEYELDLTRPVGQRVKNLRYRSAPLRDDQPLRIAINTYRAAGSSGYTMFREAKVLWRSGREIRDLMAEHYTGKKRLPERPDGNWRVLPPRAVETLAPEEASPR